MLEFGCICFTVTARLLLLHRQLQSGTCPQSHPFPLCPSDLSDTDRKGVSDPSRDTPRAQVGAGEAAATSTITRVKQAIPSPGHDKVEPLYCQIKAQMETLCKQWQKYYFLGYNVTDHTQLIGTAQIWTIYLCLNFSA